MKKEYLIPDLWVFDFTAACMQEDPKNVLSGSGNTDFDAPGRRSTAGPASL